jgi:predicted nucleotidyltransferase
MLVKEIPQKYQADLQTATNILKQAGCSDVYLFGSLVTGRVNEFSDIDIGVKGLSAGNFFRTYSKLYLSMAHQIDLVDFDKNQDFYNLLKRLNEVEKIA